MYEEFIDFESIFNLALQHTEELIKLGFNISDPCIVTPLGWYANKYPEIAELCNDALLELIEKQANTNPALVSVGYSDQNLPIF